MNYDVRLSKFLSLILRHCPEEIGVTLDENGWTSVTDLIQKVQQRFSGFDFETLDHIVRTNDKKRFEYNVSRTKIRACQGHSVKVDLKLEPLTPPDILYHGTATRFLDAIYESGIKSMSRTMVQLSTDEMTARSVGSRHGKPVLLVIEARKMHEDGFLFYLSTNQVWLTDHVPSRYIGGKILF